jgi:hypothetical protein
VTEPTPQDDGVEVVDALPVRASEAPLEPPRPAGQVAVRQAAAVAVGGFVAGAATVAAARVAKVRRNRRRSRKGQLAKVVASRSFLVDVHLLGPRD